MIENPSPNYNERPAGVPIDMLVLHYTGMKTCGDALGRLCDPAIEVSAHYLIDEDGTIHVLVAEEYRAWHAGTACWRGKAWVNDRSIGIELVNSGHEFGYEDFPPAQIEALIPLCRDILSRYPITAQNVVGHSDVAPTRKQDPGEKFPWARLAVEGIGLWPEGPMGPGAEHLDDPIALLSAIGYETANQAATVTAFQRRYRPADVSGILDAETEGLIAAVHGLQEAHLAQ
jgi:N-acetylmuramoyl-L-alanine amidase